MRTKNHEGMGKEKGGVKKYGVIDEIDYNIEDGISNLYYT